MGLFDHVTEEQWESLGKFIKSIPKHDGKKVLLQTELPEGTPYKLAPIEHWECSPECRACKWGII